MVLILWLYLLLARITLHVEPHACQAPCNVRIMVQIIPDADNRWVVVQIDGPMFQGSRIQLDGAETPKTLPYVWFRGMPAGEYEVLAVLYNSSKEIARTSTTVTVL